jgi:8-oxo-dGTP pyrophosphatase MutT (NUDIX family)
VAKKSVSAGVIVTDGVTLLLGHVTNGKNWDIPKGGIDAGETPVQGAVRELQEETGLVVEQHQLLELGVFDYKKDKQLHLFLWHVLTMPNIQDCVCQSMFDGFKGKQPELDAFQLVDWHQTADYTNKNLGRVLENLRPDVKRMIKQNS